MPYLNVLAHPVEITEFSRYARDMIGRDRELITLQNCLFESLPPIHSMKVAVV